MNRKDFKSLHVEFLRKTKESKRDRRWFAKILPERPRNIWFMSVLPPIHGLEILDLCGGYGMYGAYLQAVKRLSFGYTCLDNDKQRVEHGPKYFKNFGLKEPRFIHGDMRDPLPLQDNSYDLVWLFGWCQVKNDCIKLFNEVNRVLKPKGFFIFNMARKSVIKYVTRYSREELRNLLKLTKFNIIKLENILNKVDFGVVAVKN